MLPVSGSTKEIAAQLTELNIGIVITEYMEADVLCYLAQQKIQVYIGVKNNDPEVLVRQFLDGQLLSDQNVMQLNNN